MCVSNVSMCACRGLDNKLQLVMSWLQFVHVHALLCVVEQCLLVYCTGQPSRMLAVSAFEPHDYEFALGKFQHK